MNRQHVKVFTPEVEHRTRLSSVFLGQNSGRDHLEQTVAICPVHMHLREEETRHISALCYVIFIEALNCKILPSSPVLALMRIVLYRGEISLISGYSIE